VKSGVAAALVSFGVGLLMFESYGVLGAAFTLVLLGIGHEFDQSGDVTE
jgi:hypothetical protein